ncbi:MAG: discoidin domain-containing protein, partial [Muribaculaceae bacterium]|nr:discoidin domain-containing protein [Muribaculaceae bacterium]
MWFQLWLYYHATGHNKKFYPRLYELLRENPLRKNSTEHLNAKDDLLHFAKMCCLAAEEDLTDFFDAWGFLTPQDGYYIGDYTSYTSYLSEEDIAEWKADIAQLAEDNGWEKNTAIIFIDDRVGSTKPGYADWCQPADAGSMGGLMDYAPGAGNVNGNYEFAITGTTVTVSGATGGVGFIIYDENGKLIGFSNVTTFEVSPEAAEKIAAGTASFNVVTAENEEIEVIDMIRDGNQENKAELISQLLDKANAVIAKADFTNRKVGYIKPELVTDVKTTRDAVKEIVDNNGLTADNITELYTDLNQKVIEAEALAITPENTIWIEPDGIYVFTYNELKGIRGIQPDANAQTAIPVIGANNVDLENEAQQWLFTPATDGTSGYYIQNILSHKYLRIPDADETSLPLSDEPQKFIAELHSPGFISLAADITDSHKAIHASNGDKIVRWTTGAEASHWTIELIDDDETKTNLFALSDMIYRSEALLAQSGTLEVSAVNPQPVEISGANLFTNAPCKVTTYGDAFTDETWNHLFDNDSSTLFHSDYSTEGTSDGLNHYIRIELPSDTDFNMFILGYRTRANASQVNAPAKVQLAASNNASDWTEIANITSGLTSEFATDVELSPYKLPANTRYVRFMVNE